MERAKGGDERAVSELSERMLYDISFGTAGLRAAMGPGFNQMNCVTVQLATQGVAQYLSSQPTTLRSVIIGHDHRHNSVAFAEVAARTLKHAGIQVKTFSRTVPTPLVPFAVVKEEADFGIMITASHNPAADNGYKVYGANGCQIMSPVDKEIARLIKDQRYRLWDLSDVATPDDDGAARYDRMVREYTRSTFNLFRPVLEEFRRAQHPPLAIVYTPLHGVGLEVVQQLVDRCGLAPLTEVPSQKSPDPDFPTVHFPNPEEGLPTLAEAVKHAETLGVPLVFANDPDADRFNCAEFNAHTEQWVVFTGNEIAALLADFLWRHREALYEEGEEVDRYFVLNSCVSSKFLRAMGRQEGFEVLETLTGFKHLSNASQRLERDSSTRNKVILAYEEAIGFMVNTAVWDKDGISALLTAYLVAIEVQREGTSLQERLKRLYETYGYFCQYNSYYYCGTSSKIAPIFDRARCKLEARLDGAKVADLSGPCEIVEDGVTIRKIQDYPGTNMLTLYLDHEGLSWITLRASGTEPKIKFYSELCCHFAEREPVHTELMSIALRLCNWLLEPEKNGLCIQGTLGPASQ